MGNEKYAIIASGEAAHAVRMCGLILHQISITKKAREDCWSTARAADQTVENICTNSSQKMEAGQRGDEGNYFQLHATVGSSFDFKAG